MSTTGLSSPPPKMAPEPLLQEKSGTEVAQACMQAMQGSLACLCISIGHKLGLFRSIKQLGPCKASDLAAAAELSERWVREWLYQLSAGGFVSCDQQAATFWLSAGQAAVLVEAPEEPRSTPLEMMCMMPIILSKYKEHCRCFKSGGGLTFDEFGTEHMLHSHRVAKARHLVSHLETLPGLHQQLTQGVKVADVGCGSGEIALHLAATYRACSVVGYDVSEQALSLARQRASDKGLTNLQLLNPSDGPTSQLPGVPTYHLVVIQDSLHDMSHPQEMLKAIRQSMLTRSNSDDDSSHSTAMQNPSIASEGNDSGGTSSICTQTDALTTYNGDPVLIVSDKATAGDAASNIRTLPTAALMYGYSVGLCLGSGLSEPGGIGLGTLGLSEAVIRQMSSAAGFSHYSLLSWASSGDPNAYHMLRP